MSLFTDIHALRLATEQLVAEEKVANEHLQSIAENLTELVTLAKKLTESEVVGIDVHPAPPTTH